MELEGTEGDKERRTRRGTRLIVELEGTEGDKEVPGDCLTDAQLN